ncbi:hypothetical protein ACTFIY_011520 [Dictyostelium cf. discoideum]
MALNETQTKKQTNITSIRNHLNNTVQNPQDISNAFNNFYNKLYKSVQCSSTIHLEMLSKWIINTDNSWGNLDKPFLTHEISNTIKQINPNKAPESFSEQDYKAIDELITWFMSAPTPSNSTNNIGTSTTKNISKTTTLMC